MVDKTVSHYKILDKLGEGGMGVVYKARDTKLDREVALKFLPPHLIKKDTDLARFVQEAKAAAALNHPNVCTIHEIHDEGENPFIVMEYVEGETLKERKKDKGKRIKEVIDIALQIAEALKAAHKKGIIHRDIKSENIMVTETGQVKVMDFGLAKLRGAVKLTKSSSTVGTMAYMSPEHLQGKEVDGRTDIFSFGVVLYEMLTGQLPFKGEYDSAMMYAIINEEPEPILKHRSDLSSELLHVLNRALEKDPEERYQSVDDMLIDLKRLRRDTDTVAGKALAEMPVGSKKTKSPILKIGLRLIVGMAGLAVILFILFHLIEKRNEKLPFEKMEITRLTSHDDGNYIYYNSVARGEGIPFLYRIPVLGGSPTELLKNVSESISFSRDGSRFVFIRYALPQGKTMLLTANTDGSDERVLAECNFPEGMFTSALAWSPAGNTIVCGQFRGNIDGCTLIEINIDDAEERIINSQKWRWIENVVWSADAKNLLMNGNIRSKHNQIWGITTSKGTLRRITNDLNNYNGLSVTADGSSLITVRSDRESSIWLLPGGRTNHARQITTNIYDGAMGIAWSADGKIVHGSWDGKLWLINNDGSQPQRLSADDENDMYPSVSRDGKTVVFTTQPVSALELWKMSIDGTHRTKLANYAGDPQISPDGKWVIYTSSSEGAFTLWKISIHGGDPTPVLKSPAAGAAISPDGDRIVCFLGDVSEVDSLTIAVFPFEGGEPEHVFDLPESINPNTFLRWTPDGHAFAYVLDHEGISNIWKQPLDGGPPEQITFFKEKQIFSFAWSGNGDLACSRGKVNNDVVLIKDMK